MMFGRTTTEGERAVELFMQFMRYGLLTEVFEGQTYAGVELTEPQYRTLQYIYQHDSPTVYQVAEALLISRAAATKMVQRLEEKGLVTRRESGRDRRLLELALTPLGKEVLQAVQGCYQARLRDLLNTMPTEASQNLVQGLRSFLHTALCTQKAIDTTCLRCGWNHEPGCLVNQAQLRLTGAEVTAV
jgi:DNA-binding MarR family transcriptional regulator